MESVVTEQEETNALRFGRILSSQLSADWQYLLIPISDEVIRLPVSGIDQAIKDLGVIKRHLEQMRVI
jgi:hypothetical protein